MLNKNARMGNLVSKKIGTLDFSKHDIFQMLIAIFVLLFACFLFEYGDCKAYTQWSINIWDALAEGRISEYFLVTAENARQAYRAGNCYGILYLLPWGLWNLPIWLTHYFNGNMDINTPWCFFWSQLFLFICSLVTAYYGARIAYYFSKSKNVAKDAFILIIGAASLMVSVGYSGQDEIVYLTAFVMGIYYYISEKHGTGLIFLGISVILCNMIIIPVLAFLLFYEKNVIRLVIFVIGAILPEKLVSFVCGSKDIDYLVKSSNYKMGVQYDIDTYCGWFFNSNTRIFGIGAISLFIVVLVLIYVFAYLKRYDNNEQRKYHSLICVTVVYALLLCLFAWEHAYRYFIAVPMIIVTVLVSGKKRKDYSVGVFLIFLSEIFRTYLAISNDYIFGFSACSLSYWLKGRTSSGTLYTYLSNYYPMLENLRIVFTSVFFALILCILLYIVLPQKKCLEVEFPIGLIKYAYVSISVLVIAFFLILYCKYSITEYEIVGSDALATPINGCNSIYQVYEPKGDELDYVEIRSCTWDRKYADDLFLKVDLIDEKKQVVATEDVWANDLLNNDVVRINFNAEVVRGKKYYLHFYLDEFIDDEEQWVYLMRSKEEIAQQYGLYGIIEENYTLGEEIYYNVISTIAEEY